MFRSRLRREWPQFPVWCSGHDDPWPLGGIVDQSCLQDRRRVGRLDGGCIVSDGANHHNLGDPTRFARDDDSQRDLVFPAVRSRDRAGRRRALARAAPGRRRDAATDAAPGDHSRHERQRQVEVASDGHRERALDEQLVPRGDATKRVSDMVGMMVTEGAPQPHRPRRLQGLRTTSGARRSGTRSRHLSVARRFGGADRAKVSG
jgi:hypothetical protein